MNPGEDDVQSKRREAMEARAGRERASAARGLRERADYRPELDYFIQRLEESAEDTATRLGRPLAALLCLQAPLEIFHALGFQAYRVFSGGQAYGQAMAPFLPALACPMLRSTLGALGGLADRVAAWVVPTACDWVVKFPEMAELAGLAAPEPLRWLELPHLREQPAGQARWLGEIQGLAAFLERLAGRRLTAANLRESMEVYQRAWRIFGSLIARRRDGRVPAVWFMTIANAFLRDAPERWSAAVENALPGFAEAKSGGGRVFLAGSPIFYPNYKVPALLEEAGLTVAADDLCSSERIFPGAVFYRDPSLSGLLSALAERYHQGCLCPTFADNQRRPAAILNQADQVDGVVFHVLKGCHPYDLESFGLGRILKERGLRFLRLETDYAEEDRRNLFARLEAFSASLPKG